MLDEFTRIRVDRILELFVEIKVPRHVRSELKLNYKFRGHSVTLFEERLAYTRDRWIELDVAQFRLDKQTNKWSVYWRDSKDKWHFVDDITPDEDFEKQLQQVDRDPKGMFWN